MSSDKDVSKDLNSESLEIDISKEEVIKPLQQRKKFSFGNLEIVGQKSFENNQSFGEENQIGYSL